MKDIQQTNAPKDDKQTNKKKPHKTKVPHSVLLLSEKELDQKNKLLRKIFDINGHYIMRKTRLYLDTSIVSFLDEPRSAEKMAVTLELWDEIKTGKYEVYLSDVVFDEVNKCKQPKRGKMHSFLAIIDFIHLPPNEIVRNIADEVIRSGILKPKNDNDCLHIGYAIFGECDFLVSWNFDDLANVKTNRGVRSITNLRGYKNIDIISPFNIIRQEV